ncbi:MAG TPA: ABC transporter ATP-binding protein [Solirubrobacteraceae bacterium]|nr:ABC transporter ATP-binding protein [Solirubrobacteraceae bacterium]
MVAAGETVAADPSSLPERAAPAVRLERVTRRYTGRRGVVTALQDVSLALARGEIMAVVGPSGCGKSTLLELVCGLQRPDEGTVQAEPAVLMPQRDLLLPWASALDNAGLALRAQGLPRAEARRRAAPWLDRLGLAEFADARPAELSGGMRQRISFVRSLLAGKDVLALDEPFASLDAITRAEGQAWLAEALAAEPRTVLLVTHDVEEAVLLADRIAVLSARPGRMLAELANPASRPRHRTDPELIALRERVLVTLGAPA